MSTILINKQRAARLQELRAKLPARCDFANSISNTLKKKGFDVPPPRIYKMLHGKATVNTKVIKEMEVLVELFTTYSPEKTK